MALQLRVLAPESNDLSLIPQTHVVKGENRLPQVVFSHPYTHHDMGTCPHTGIEAHIYTLNTSIMLF